MQTNTGNARALERRLNVAVPIAEIEGEVEEAADAPRAHRQDRRLPARQGAAEDARPAIRPAGALGRASRERVQKSFNDAVRAQNLRVAGYSAHRAAARRQAGDGALEFSRGLRGLSRRPDRRRRPTSRSSGRSPRSATPDVDRTLEILRKQRTTYRRSSARRRRRSRARRLHRHDRRRRVRRAARRAIFRSCSAKGGCCRNSRRRSPGMQAGRDARRSR